MLASILALSNNATIVWIFGIAVLGFAVSRGDKTPKP